MRIIPTFIAVGLLGGLYLLSDSEKIEPAEKPRIQASALENAVSFNQDAISVKIELTEDERLQFYAEHISGYEGKRKKVYDPNPKDRKYEPTIGVGHKLLGKDSIQRFSKALPEVSYKDVKSGKVSLTDDQINKLFAEDLKFYVNRARNRVRGFDEYPLEVQTVLVSMAYRGELGIGNKTVELLNQGKIYDAAIEYANRRDYNKEGMGGIKSRIDNNQKVLIKYAQSMGNAPSSK